MRAKVGKIQATRTVAATGDGRREESDRRVREAERRAREAERENTDVKREKEIAERQAREAESQVRAMEGRAREAERSVRDGEREKEDIKRGKDIAERQAMEAEGRAREAQRGKETAENRQRGAEQRLVVSEGKLQRLETQWVVERREIQLTDQEVGRGAWATVSVAMEHVWLPSVSTIRLCRNTTSSCSNGRWTWPPEYATPTCCCSLEPPWKKKW